jgi:Cu2+-containing amine oxidase
MTAHDIVEPPGADGRAESETTGSTLHAADINSSKDDKRPLGQPHHPLGPLSAQEIARSSSLIKGLWPKNTDCHFKVITLLEPAKAVLIPYLKSEREGHSPPSLDRRATILYYLRGTVSRAGSRALFMSLALINSSSTTFTK